MKVLRNPGAVAAVLAAFCLLTLSTMPPVINAQTDGIITTVAGTGVCGFSGDGGRATNAQVCGVPGIAVDAEGSLYLADMCNHVIRKISRFGTIATIAGTGAPGYNGNSKLGTNTQLAVPMGVALDPSGRYLYIVDNGNHAIRRLDLSTSTITTFAGAPGDPGFEGDGGPATLAKLKYPAAIAVDQAGNVYVSDSQNARVRKIDTNGTITTFAGSGAFGDFGDGGPAIVAGFKEPAGLAAGPSGTVYVADRYSHRVRKIDAGGIITNILGDGNYLMPTLPGDSGSPVRFPQGLAVDGFGNLYVSDFASHLVVRLTPAGRLECVAGTGSGGFGGDNGPACQSMLNGPAGLAVDPSSTRLFIGDTLNCRVRQVTLQ